jgi:hypothetical protein
MFSLYLFLSPTSQRSFVQIILAQADLDAAVLKLLEKISEVYSFMTQDEKLKQILSMHDILGKISQQTRECARFITNYSETKNFCECYELLRYVPSRASTIITGKRLGRDVLAETDDTINKYNDVFEGLMQNFRDQVARDVAIGVRDIGTQVHDIGIHVHRTGKGSDVIVT